MSTDKQDEIPEFPYRDWKMYPGRDFKAIEAEVLVTGLYEIAANKLKKKGSNVTPKKKKRKK